MKLIKFRIKNFRSIIDSGDCYLTDNITILAGKNESGKTSVLEALEDFDADKTIRKEAIPIKNTNNKPSISVTFEISKSTLTDILNKIELNKSLDSMEIEIIKEYPDKYKIAEESRKRLDLTNKDEIEKEMKKLLDYLHKIHQKYAQLGGDLPTASDKIDTFKSELETFRDTTNPNLEQIEVEKERTQFSTYLQNLINKAEKLNNLKDIEDKFIEVLKEKYIPYFIFFNSFDDIFPNKVPFAELEDNEWVQDLSVISDLNIETIKSSEDRTKHKHKTDININLNDDYKKFWTQDVSNLSVDWDSDSLLFWIEEDNYPYEPSLRSKGRQWHLAFYIKITARAKESLPNIILIDEPGLFLHAKAQKDILEKLEDSSKEAQLIFSTHSPYLLEADKLNRIRLITRHKKKGTEIINKIHALADKETLTPILTAIGLELSSGITNLDKLNNVVVEGQSDIFYLQAFKKLVNNNDINFIFGGGAGNMPFVGTVLHGWGCKVVYLYDKDQGKKDGVKNLTKTWLVSKKLILSVLEKEGTIEDIFSAEDFKKFVIKEEKEYSGSNSEYVKQKKMDKVLLARLFLQSVETDNIKLSQESMDNINKLFELLDETFKVLDK